MPFDAEPDWLRVKLSDLTASLDAGVSVNSEGRVCERGEIGVLKTSSVGGGRFKASEHKAVLPGEMDRVRTQVAGDSIILSRMNTPDLVGENAYVEEDHPTLFLPDRLWLLKTNERADCRWLSYFMQSEFFRSHLDEIATGTSGSMKNISKARLAELFLFLPPLDEQRRIAEVLRSVDKAIHLARVAEAQAIVVLKRTVLDRLEPHRHGVDPRGDLRSQVRIGDLGKVQAGRQRAPSFTKGQLCPYLRVANVFDGFIDTSDILRMPFTERERNEYRLEAGDILLNEGQSLELVGRAAVYKGDPIDCCFQNTLVRFRPSKVSVGFAFAMVRNLYWTGRLSAIASRTTSVAHLGVSRFANLRVHMPAKDEQEEIAELHEGLSTQVGECAKAVDAARWLRSELMKTLISGRVRVPA